MHELTLHDEPDANGRPVTHTYRFPSGWNEVDTTHLPHIINARIQNKPDEIGARPNDGWVRFSLLQNLAGIPDKLMLRMPPADALTYQVEKPDGLRAWQLLPELDWVFTAPLFEKSLLPTITHKNIAFAGPQDGLQTMPLKQWLFVTSCRDRFYADADSATKDVELNNFLGALYQPSYAAWANEPIEEYGAMLADLPLDTKLCALFNYEALYGQLPLMYPRTFDPYGDASESPAGIFAIAYEVAKSGVFGDLDKANTRDIHQVFAYMEHELYKESTNSTATPPDEIVLMKNRF